MFAASQPRLSLSAGQWSEPPSAWGENTPRPKARKELRAFMQLKHLVEIFQVTVNVISMTVGCPSPYGALSRRLDFRLRFRARLWDAPSMMPVHFSAMAKTAFRVHCDVAITTTLLVGPAGVGFVAENVRHSSPCTVEASFVAVRHATWNEL